MINFYTNVMDISKVTNLSRCFANCYNLKFINLGTNNPLYAKYNTTESLDASNMFTNCQNLMNINLGSGNNFNMFSAGTLTNATHMFANCVNFVGHSPYTTSPAPLGFLNLTGCQNTSKMFYNCYQLNKPIWFCNNKSNLNLINCKDASYMFYNCKNLMVDISAFGDFSSLESSAFMFNAVKCNKSFNIDVSKLNKSIYAPSMFAIYLENATADINFANVTFEKQACLDSFIEINGNIKLNMYNLYIPEEARCRSIISLYSGNLQGDLNMSYANMPSCNYLMLQGEHNISNFDASYAYLPNLSFDGSSFTRVVKKAAEVNMSHITMNFNNIANFCALGYNPNSKLTRVNLSDINFANCINMSYLVSDCINLTDLDMSNCIITNNINLIGTFRNCQNLVNLNLSNTVINNPISTDNMFANCFNLSNVNLEGLDLGNVTTTTAMFYNCINLQNIGISDITINSFVNCDRMFYNSSNLNLNSVSLNTNKLYSTFYRAMDIKYINLKTPDNTISCNLSFHNCQNLISLNLDDSVFMNCHGYELFSYCQNLVSLPNANWLLQNCRATFSHCNNLVNVPYLRLSNIPEFYATFSHCNNLSDASIQNIINSLLNGTYTSNCFKNLSTDNNYSPFLYTNIVNTRYQNRWEELTAAGWTF